MLVPVPYVAVYAWLEVSCDTVEVQPAFVGGLCSGLDGVFRLVSGNAFHVVEYLMFVLRGITGCPGNVCIFSRGCQTSVACGRAFSTKAGHGFVFSLYNRLQLHV